MDVTKAETTDLLKYLDCIGFKGIADSDFFESLIELAVQIVDYANQPESTETRPNPAPVLEAIRQTKKTVQKHEISRLHAASMLEWIHRLLMRYDAVKTAKNALKLKHDYKWQEIKATIARCKERAVEP